MKLSEKKLYFIIVFPALFLVCMFATASEPDKGKLLLPAMIIFGFGLFNSYGITFNSHVSGSSFESKSEKDDQYGLRNVWGFLGYIMLLVSYVLLFL